MSAPGSQLRGSITALALILVAWVFLPAAGRLFTRETFAELQAPSLNLLSRTRDLVLTAEMKASGAAELAAAGRDLARANAGLELRIAELESAAAENRRLRSMLAAPAFPEFRTLVARVAARESGAWWSSLTIRRGRIDGVRKGCPVVFGNRVVGRVTYLPYTYSVPAGQPARVVTTGLGGLYPAGLKLGTLSPGLEDTPGGAYRNGVFTPAADLLSLREVGVLIPTQPQPYEELR